MAFLEKKYKKLYEIQDKVLNLLAKSINPPKAICARIRNTDVSLKATPTISR